MKTFTTDHQALAYLDSVYALQGGTRHDPLDAVLILADVTSRDGFSQQRFCRWCENPKAGRRLEPRTRKNAAGELVPHDGLWSDFLGRPVRRGADNPLDSCGHCVIGKLNVTEVPDPQPLTLDDKIDLSALQAKTWRSSIDELLANPIANADRIAHARERLARIEERHHHQVAAREVRSGKRRVLVQHFATNRASQTHPHGPTAPLEEHWCHVSDYDPEGIGSNAGARLTAPEAQQVERFLATLPEGRRLPRRAYEVPVSKTA